VLSGLLIALSWWAVSSAKTWVTIASPRSNNTSGSSTVDGPNSGTIAAVGGALGGGVEGSGAIVGLREGALAGVCDPVFRRHGPK
jgi:hypothetical protein